MASIDEVYRKFGIAAEAAQLLETELGTLLIGMRGLSNDWHIASPDFQTGRKAVAEIDSQTLGAMLRSLWKVAKVDDALIEKLSSALNARNRLIHGFYERHNFGSQTNAGRDQMMVELDALHDELFRGWRLASAMTDVFLSLFSDYKERKAEIAKDGECPVEFRIERAGE